MMDILPVTCFAPGPHATVEYFADGALAFLLDELLLVRMGRFTARLVELAGTGLNVGLITDKLADECAGDKDGLKAIVINGLCAMERQRVLRRCVTWNRGATKMNEIDHLMINPDVSFRQEDEDGAILFNPDTDGLKVVNPTGIVIWRFLAQPHTQAEVIAHLLEAFDGAPESQVAGDAEAFIKDLVQGGFIGSLREVPHG